MTDNKYAGYTKRDDGYYVPEGEMKTLTLQKRMGNPDVIICDGKKYYPALDDGATDIIARFVASLLEDEDYAATKMGQSQPVYYAIRDKQRSVSAEGYSDLMIFRFNDGEGPDGEYYLRDALAVYIGQDEFNEGIEWYGDDEIEAHISHVEFLDDVLDNNGEIRDDVSVSRIRFILDSLGIGEIIYVSDEWVICPNTMFLTHKDAAAHLNANRHHYTKDAHVYCMTAWRSPEYEKFITALKSMFKANSQLD